MNNSVQTQTQDRPQRLQHDRGFVTPPANISVAENEYLVEIEMPGVDKDGLEITVEGNELTLIGRRKTEHTPGELCYCESTQADFRRVFELGPDVDTSRINARLEQGVLKLRLPKSENAKPKKIQINA